MTFIIVFVILLILAVVFGLLWLHSYNQDKRPPKERGDELRDTKHSTEMNRFAARKEEKAALARAGTATAIATEIAAVNAPARMELEDNVTRAAAENQILVSNKAAEHEMDPATYGRKKQSEIDIDVARQLSDIKIGEHDELKKIDLDARWKEILQDLNGADFVQMGDHQLLNKEREYLAAEIRKRQELISGNDDQSVKDELHIDYDQHIEFLKRRINARQARLLLSENEKETPRLAESQAESRAEYPAETDEDSE